MAGLRLPLVVLRILRSVPGAALESLLTGPGVYEYSMAAPEERNRHVEAPRPAQAHVPPVRRAFQLPVSSIEELEPRPEHPWYNLSDSVERKRVAFAGKDPFGKTYLVMIPDYRRMTPAMQNNITAVVGFAQALMADRSEDPTLAMVGRMIAETTLPHPTYASKEEVRWQVLRWAQAIWTRQDRQIEGMRIRMQDYMADREAGGRLIGENVPQIGAQFTEEHDAWAFLCWVAHRGISDEMTHLVAVSYSYAYIALAKKGTITPDKARSISQALSREVGVPINFDRTLIPLLSSTMSARIGDDEYPDVFRTWEQEITGVSLRMQITLAQAAGTGMTALSTVKNALQTFKDFDWARLCAVLPQDAERVTAAFLAVGNDKYYGFRKSYGVAAATGYRSFAWVAKELLIRYGGPDFASLREYRGWTNNPLHKETLRVMVEEYRPTVATEGVPPAELATMYEAMRAAGGV